MLVDKLGQSVSNPNPAHDVSFLFTTPVLGQFPTESYAPLWPLIETTARGESFNRGVIFSPVVYYEFSRLRQTLCSKVEIERLEIMISVFSFTICLATLDALCIL